MKPNLSTLCAQAKIEDNTGAINKPVFLTSTFAKTSLSVQPEFEYSRVSNPTRTLLEQQLAQMEHARFGLCCSSGQATAVLVLSLLQAKDHIIVHTNSYDGTLRLLKLFSQFGINSTRVDLTKPALIPPAITPHTRLIWFETPSNPLLEIIDIQTITHLAHNHQIMVVIDNTFLGPCSQSPILRGADIVIQSLTKSLAGHSDVTGGVCITNQSHLHQQLFHHHHTLGLALPPFDCFLTLRGLKTLPIRIKGMEKNALKVARFLSHHPQIDSVIFPGLANHPQHLLIKKQMKGPGNIVSFCVKGSPRSIQAWVQRLKLIKLASSLGGTETLIQHPRTMIDHTLNPAQLNAIGLTHNLFRLSVGLEDSRDIIHDLDQALIIKQ